MDRGKELGPEEEPRLALSHEIRKMAETYGITEKLRVPDHMRNDLIAFGKDPKYEADFRRLMGSWHEVYQIIDEIMPGGPSARFKIAIALEMTAIMLDAGRVEDALDELYDARTMIDNEEPENIDQIEALYQQVKEIVK